METTTAKPGRLSALKKAIEAKIHKETETAETQKETKIQPSRPEMARPEAKIPDLNDQAAWDKEKAGLLSALKDGNAILIRTHYSELCKNLLNKIIDKNNPERSAYMARLLELLAAKDERGIPGFYFACLQNYSDVIVEFRKIFVLTSDDNSDVVTRLIDLPEIQKLLVEVFLAKDWAYDKATGEHREGVTALYWMKILGHTVGLQESRKLIQLLPKQEQVNLNVKLLAIKNKDNPPAMCEALVKGKPNAVLECGEFLEPVPERERGTEEFITLLVATGSDGIPGICTAVLNEKWEAVNAFDEEILSLLSREQLDKFLNAIFHPNVTSLLNRDENIKMTVWKDRVTKNFTTWRENRADKYYNSKEYVQAYKIYNELALESNVSALFKLAKLHTDGFVMQEVTDVYASLKFAYEGGHMGAGKLLSKWCLERFKVKIAEDLDKAKQYKNKKDYEGAYSIYFALAEEKHNPDAMVALVEMRQAEQCSLTRDQVTKYLKLAHLCGHDNAGNMLITWFKMISEHRSAKLWTEMVALQFPTVEKKEPETLVQNNNPPKISGAISGAQTSEPVNMQFADKYAAAPHATWKPYIDIVDSDKTVEQILGESAFNLYLAFASGHSANMEDCHTTLKAILFRQITKDNYFSAGEFDQIIQFLEAKTVNDQGNFQKEYTSEGKAGIFVAFQKQFINKDEGKNYPEVIADYKKLVEGAKLSKEQHNGLMDALIKNPSHQGSGGILFIEMIEEWRNEYKGT